MIATAPSPSVSIADLDTLARRLAAMSDADTERLIAAEVTLAVRERRIDDAVRWQRIRLRARNLRRRVAPG